MQISRRRFAHLASTAALAGPPLLAQSSLTAQQVVDRIRKNAGVPWQPLSLDTFKAGDPATPVTGIATTGMAIMDVLTRASKDKTNLVRYSLNCLRFHLAFHTTSIEQINSDTLVAKGLMTYPAKRAANATAT